MTMGSGDRSQVCVRMNLNLMKSWWQTRHPQRYINKGEINSVFTKKAWKSEERKMHERAFWVADSGPGFMKTLVGDALQSLTHGDVDLCGTWRILHITLHRLVCSDRLLLELRSTVHFILCCLQLVLALKDVDFFFFGVHLANCQDQTSNEHA